MQPPQNGQKRPFLAQNSHLAHFCRLEQGQTWNTLSVQNASGVLFYQVQIVFSPKSIKTLLKCQKHSKVAILSLKMAIFGHFNEGVPWGFET